MRGSRARKIPDRLDISKISSTRQTGLREHSAADQHSIAAGRGQLLQDDPRLQSARAGGNGGSEGGRRRVLRSSGGVEEASSAATATGNSGSAGESSPRPNHIRLRIDRHLDSAPQLQLRVRGQRGDLTNDARSNLLIELAGATTDKERCSIHSHYGVDRSTARCIRKKWRERGHARLAARPGRPSVMSSPGHQAALRLLNRNNRAAGARKLSECSRALSSLRGGTSPALNPPFPYPRQPYPPRSPRSVSVSTITCFVFTRPSTKAKSYGW